MLIVPLSGVFAPVACRLPPGLVIGAGKGVDPAWAKIRPFVPPVPDPRPGLVNWPLIKFLRIGAGDLHVRGVVQYIGWREGEIPAAPPECSGAGDRPCTAELARAGELQRR